MIQTRLEGKKKKVGRRNLFAQRTEKFKGVWLQAQLDLGVFKNVVIRTWLHLAHLRTTASQGTFLPSMLAHIRLQAASAAASLPRGALAPTFSPRRHLFFLQDTAQMSSPLGRLSVPRA